jgi:DNA-binding winged helix-turn-helix (wHTH) protein
LLEPHLANDRLISRAGELEDLFRKLFRAEGAIRLERQLWQAGGRVALLVMAFAEKRAHEALIVVCDTYAGGREETHRYREYAPPAGGETATLWRGAATTTHFAANAYALAGNPDFVTLHRLIDLYRANAERPFNAALAGLVNETLAAWHQDKRSLDPQHPLDAAYRGRLGLDPARFPAAQAVARVETLVAQLPLLGVTARYSAGELTIGFDGQTATYPDPVAAIYRSYGDGSAAVLLATPGRVDGETVLVDEQGHAWLTDFAAAGRAPLLWNFVTLEAAIRFDWIEEKNLRRRDELERWLNGGEFVPLAVTDLEPSVRRAAQAILRLHLGILFHAARRLAAFNPALRLTPGDLARLGHALLAVAQLGALLTRQPPAPDPAAGGVRVDRANQAVWVRGRRVPVRGQSYRLLCHLQDHAGRLCTRRSLVEAVLDERYDEQNSAQKDRLNVAILRLREKIEDDPSRPRYLLTEPGGGYRLVSAAE